MDHLSRHRFESAPAQPAWSIVPPVLLETKASAAYDIPVAVDLDADGHLLAIHEGNMIVPEQVRAVVEQMTFLPAVENGQAIATTLTFNPAGFFKAGSR